MKKVTALIVDDSSVMRKIVERSLRQAGIDLVEVREAGNGAEALTTLKGARVDLILCDINMPVMDGIEFLRQLQGVERQNHSRGDDHHRRQRIARGTSAFGWRPRIYPEAFHAGASERTRDSPPG